MTHCFLRTWPCDHYFGYVQGGGDHSSVGTLGEADLVADPEKSGVDGGLFYSEECNEETELVTDSC